jgi:hypothetical protein
MSFFNRVGRRIKEALALPIPSCIRPRGILAYAAAAAVHLVEHFENHFCFLPLGHAFGTKHHRRQKWVERTRLSDLDHRCCLFSEPTESKRLNFHSTSLLLLLRNQKSALARSSVFPLRAPFKADTCWISNLMYAWMLGMMMIVDRR